MVNQPVIILSQAEALETARKYVNAVRAFGVNIRKAFLFGSYAKNRQHEWSDIDVALIGDDFVGSPVIDNEIFLDLQIRNEFIDVETHTFPTVCLTNGDAFLNEVVFRTGIEID